MTALYEQISLRNVAREGTFFLPKKPPLCTCRYDYGCEGITNVDFSKPVIANMMRKNLRQRTKMKWKVGDMTDLKVQFRCSELPSELVF